MPQKYSGHAILEDLAPVSFYPRWIMEQFTPFIGRKIIEIGAGIGTMSALLPPNRQITLTDLDPQYITRLKNRFSYPGYVWDVQKSPPHKLLSGSFDTAISVNVLEHVPDDARAFQNIHQLLRPGGYLLLYVPAKQLLFGATDRVLDHQRRYEKEQLNLLLTRTGFQVVILKYCNFPGFFAWGIVSRLLRLRRLGALPVIYDRLVTPWLKIEPKFHLPFGQNLLAVAVKPARISPRTTKPLRRLAS